MRFSLALSVASLAIAVGALTVTEPKKGDSIAPGASVDVKWTSVNTDATSFDIYLVNNAVYPSVNKKLATGIQTSKNSETVSVGNIPDGHGYQINLISDDPKNTGILAQTGQFNVTGSAQSSSSSSSSTTSTASVTSISSHSTSSATATGNSTSISTTSLTSHLSSSSTSSNATVTTSHFTTTSTGVSTTAVITGEVTKTAGASGLKTSASASASASTTSAPHNAGAAVLAHPVAALGVVGGALAFML